MTNWLNPEDVKAEMRTIGNASLPETERRHNVRTTRILEAIAALPEPPNECDVSCESLGWDPDNAKGGVCGWKPEDHGEGKGTGLKHKHEEPLLHRLWLIARIVTGRTP